MAKRTERTTVRATLLNQAIVNAGAALVGLDTPTYFATAAIEKARRELPAARLTEIERRFLDGRPAAAATD